MKNRITKIIFVSFILIICCLCLYGCSSKKSTVDDNAAPIENKMISISGSTSVGPLMEVLAENYERKNPDIDIEIQQIGSSAGIKNAIAGVSDIGMSSRDLKPDELSKVAPLVIAYDGIVVITNKDNVVSNLKLDQIEDIFTGKIKNWSEVGGEDQPIVVVSRENGSGTRDAFEEIVDYDSDELEPSAIIADGNGSIKTTVMGNKNAVGYISFEYLDDEIKGLNCDGVAPTAANVLNKTYKLSRAFIIAFRKDEISTQANEFVQYILSDAGQTVVEDNGNIRLK